MPLSVCIVQVLPEASFNEFMHGGKKFPPNEGLQCACQTARSSVT